MRAIIKCPYCGRVSFSLMPHDVECVSCQKVVATVNAGELKERRIDKSGYTPYYDYTTYSSTIKG